MAFLVSIIGRVIALRYRENHPAFSGVDKSGLAFAVIVLGFTAVRHIDLILSFEISARDKLDECDKELGISNYALMSRGRPNRDPNAKWVSYKATIILLALAAIFIIIFGSYEVFGIRLITQ